MRIITSNNVCLRRQLSSAPPPCHSLRRATAAVTSSIRPQIRPNFNMNTRLDAMPNARVNFFNFFGGSNTQQADEEDDYEEGDVTVCKLQIGMFGDIKKWQERLNRTVENNDTSDEEGLHNVFRDAVMLVLRNIEYAGYCSTAGKVFGNLDAAERKFNAVLTEERLKFKEETLSNVQGNKKSRALDDEYRGKDKDGLDRWLCMTILMAVEGKVKIPPKINSTYELKQVLTQLGGLTAEDLVAFELLWTPQDENDYYTKNELLEDYPTMITLS